MSTLLDYKNSCRICLRSDGGPTNVFNYTIAGYQRPLAVIIFAMFRIKWQNHSDFPSSLCRRCSIEMEQVLLFKKEIKKNQRHLSKLQNAKSTVTCTTKLEPDESLKTLQSGVDVKAELGSKIIKVEKAIPKRRKRTELPSRKSSRKRFTRFINENVSSNCNDKTEIKSENVSPKLELSQNTDLLQAEYPTVASSTTPPPEQKIPQVVFLQNLNLLTRQEAEILQKKEPVKRKGKDSIPKKFDDLKSHVPKSNNKIMGKVISKKSKKRRSRRSTQSILIQNRSLDFLYRYGFRKIDSPIQLKRGKAVLRPQDDNSSFSQIRFRVSRRGVPETSMSCENTSVRKRRKK